MVPQAGPWLPCRIILLFELDLASPSEPDAGWLVSWPAMVVFVGVARAWVRVRLQSTLGTTWDWTPDRLGPFCDFQGAPGGLCRELWFRGFGNLTGRN